MRVLISADMEGTTGVTGWKDVTPGAPEWSYFRRLLTADVNAAVRGAFEGGASEVVVNEGHWTMRNVLIDELDPRAQVISGSLKPLVMMEGLELSDLVYFVAYHARAGQAGVLAHTSVGEFAHVELNGHPCSEARFNALVAGEQGKAVGLVTGDDVICAEARELFPGVKTAIVKYAIDNFSARCLAPKASQALIQQAAQEAVHDAGNLVPYRLDPPFEVSVTLRNATQAAVASNLPGIFRSGERKIRFSSPTAREAYGLLEVVGTIAESVSRD